MGTNPNGSGLQGSSQISLKKADYTEPAVRLEAVGDSVREMGLMLKQVLEGMKDKKQEKSPRLPESADDESSEEGYVEVRSWRKKKPKTSRL